MSEKKKDSETYGFLAIAGDIDEGLVGGCLILNGRGRPLEFYCTAPVRPNRAEVILYGVTLRPHVVGEQIAPALLAKIKLAPTLLWTDDPDVVSVRETIDSPVGCLPSCGQIGPDRSLLSMQLSDDDRAWVHAHYSEDVQRIQNRWDAPSRWIDFREPFTRIQEAIAEALNKNARAA